MWEEDRRSYFLAGLIHRCNYTCKSAPVKEFLLGKLEEKNLFYFLFSAKATDDADPEKTKKTIERLAEEESYSVLARQATRLAP